MQPTEITAHERTVLFHHLLNHLDASGRMVAEVAGSRWQVAVTRLRKGLKDGGLTRAVSRYWSGLFLSKDDAVTDFVQDVVILGKRQDVMVSWASSASALREELLVIQSCLNTAGILDEPLDFDLGVDMSLMKKTLGASVQYENKSRHVEIQADADPAKLLSGVLSLHLHGRLGFGLHKNRLQGDPRLPMMAGIIALEAGGGMNLTCQKLADIIGMLSSRSLPDQKVDYAQSYLQPAERYLRDVFAALKPRIQALGIQRGTPPEKKNGLLVDALLIDLFGKQPDFDGAFATLKILRDTFEGVNFKDEQAQSIWTLLSAAVYLGGQIAAAKTLLPDPSPGANPEETLYAVGVRP